MNPRFNPDCSTFEQVEQYYIKRALQLKRFNYELLEIHEENFGAVSFYQLKKYKYGSHIYISIYIYPEFRG